MTQQLSKIKTYSDYSAEAGVYLPIMAVGIVVLLAVSALSLDTANMFNTKLQYKKASDAAVIGALEYRVRRGFSPDRYDVSHTHDFTSVNFTEKFNDNPNQEGGQNTSFEHISHSIANRAREIARNNILFNLPKQFGADGLTEDKISIEFEGPDDSNENSEVLKVSITKPQNYLMMSSIPFQVLGMTNTFDQFQVDNESTGNIKQANIVLMIDLSNSMLCPDSVPSNYDPINPTAFLDYDNFTTQCLEAKELRVKIEQEYGGIPGDFDEIVAVDLDGDGINEKNSTINEANALISNYCYCGCLSTGGCQPTHTLFHNYSYNVGPPATISTGSASTVFGNKLYGLIKGIDLFLERFRPGKDNIGIIAFNSSSHIWLPLGPLRQDDVNFWDIGQMIAPTNANNNPGRTIDNTKMQNIFDRFTGGDDGLRLGHWTNHADALLTAFKHNKDFDALNDGSGLTPRHETHYVFFTDGAPTATRILTDNSSFFNSSALESHIDTDLNNNNIDGDVLLLAATSPGLQSVVKNDHGVLAVQASRSKTLWSPLPLMTTPVPTMGNGTSTASTEYANASGKTFYYNYITNTNTAAFNNHVHALRIDDIRDNDTLLSTLTPDNVNSANTYRTDRPHTYKSFMPDAWNFNNELSLVYDPGQDPYTGTSNNGYFQPKHYQMTNRFEVNCTPQLTNGSPNPEWMIVPESSDPADPFTLGPWDSDNGGACFNTALHSVDGSSPSPSIDMDYTDIFYTQPIHFADMIRRYKGRIHTIGYGPDDDNKSSLFQSKGDAFARKDVLLARIAGDNKAITDIANASGSSISFTTNGGYTVTSSVDDRKAGSYERAETSASLAAAFEEIADLIVRLTK